MKEIPMLFSTDMVQSLIDKLKTETRRLKGLEMFNMFPNAIGNEIYLRADSNGLYAVADFSQMTDAEFDAIMKAFPGKVPGTVKCPYGKPGDVIWVRETWCRNLDCGDEFFYKATEPQTESGEDDGSPWKPSIHMPKSAARIWLQIVSIGMERLQSISNESAIAEGIESEEWTWGATAFPDGHIDKSLVGLKTKFFKDYIRDKHWTSNAIDSYQSLWVVLNGQESWNHNPWVWVIKFKILSTTGKPDLSHVHLATHV